MPKAANELRAFRRALDLNQQDFWSLLGVTQSACSRYEKGRKLSPPVTRLLDIIYVKGVTLARLAVNDFGATRSESN